MLARTGSAICQAAAPPANRPIHRLRRACKHAPYLTVNETPANTSLNRSGGWARNQKLNSLAAARLAQALAGRTKEEESVEDIWDESASVPFWGRVEQLQKLSDLVRRSVETVTESESPREMVLETWLVLDYAVRDLLVSGYGLYKFCQEDFDLRYILLSKSFESLLHLLKETIHYQSGVSQEASPSDDCPPYIRSSFSFLKYLAQNHAEIAETLTKIEAEYFAERHPELAEQIKQGVQFYHMRREEGTEALPSGWLEVVSNLGDDWFRLAKRLNKARNKAAHSHDASAIAKAFGIAGPQAVDMVRAECLQLLKNLLGITLNVGGTGKSGERG